MQELANGVVALKTLREVGANLAKAIATLLQKTAGLLEPADGLNNNRESPKFRNLCRKVKNFIRALTTMVALLDLVYLKVFPSSEDWGERRSPLFIILYTTSTKSLIFMSTSKSSLHITIIP